MSARTVVALALADIDCRPQVREAFDEEAIAGLAASLVTAGLLQPILVRAVGDRFVVIDGERRYRAATVAGWETIEALVEPEAKPDGAQRIVRQLVANCQRQDLTPIETARAIEALMGQTGCSASEAAAKLGLSGPRVSKLLALLSLPETVQDEVHAGKLAASTAYEIAKTKDPERRAELIAEAGKGELKRDAAALRSRATGKPRSSASRASKASKRSRPRKRKTTIPVGPGCSVVIAGDEIVVAELLASFEAVCARLRALGEAGTEPVVPLAEALGRLATATQDGAARAERSNGAPRNAGREH